MKVYSFKSTKNHESYGFTPQRGGANLPSDLGPWRRHSESDMNRGDPPRLAIRAEEVLDGIARRGFQVVGIRIAVTESIVSSRQETRCGVDARQGIVHKRVHRRLAIEAKRSGITLNALVAQKLARDAERDA